MTAMMPVRMARERTQCNSQGNQTSLGNVTPDHRKKILLLLGKQTPDTGENGEPIALVYVL